MTSSLLRPNLRLAQRFNNLAELMQVVATPDVDTVRLDDVAEIRAQGCDLLKLDTQGGEAEILAHASETLERCLIIQTEVEFVPPIDQSPAAHLTFHDREHVSAIVNTAPCGAPKCSRSNGNLFTLPWNPCSRSRGNTFHHRVEYAPWTPPFDGRV
jgi:Methyltransferase FkbM domain